MECLFYTTKDVEKLTGFKHTKASQIILELNTQLKQEYEERIKKGEDIRKPLILEGRIEKSYFHNKVMPFGMEEKYERNVTE